MNVWNDNPLLSSMPYGCDPANGHECDRHKIERLETLISDLAQQLHEAQTIIARLTAGVEHH